MQLALLLLGSAASPWVGPLPNFYSDHPCPNVGIHDVALADCQRLCARWASYPYFWSVHVPPTRPPLLVVYPNLPNMRCQTPNLPLIYHNLSLVLQP